MWVGYLFELISGPIISERPNSLPTSVTVFDEETPNELNLMQLPCSNKYSAGTGTSNLVKNGKFT